MADGECDATSASVNLAGDRISALPDVILQQILSYNTTKFGISTSVLSKRWKHVWYDTPSMSFFDCTRKVDASLINKAVRNYSAPKLRRFYLRVCSEYTASQIDSWIEFAISRNAEELSLLGNTYRFQNSFFVNASVKQLILTFHDTTIPSCTVSWTSLRSLSLRFSKLSNESIANILSGCPMLESLTLENCNGLDHLDLSKSLRLDIAHCEWGFQGPMHIRAPHIHHLRFISGWRPFKLVDVSSVTEANLRLPYFSNGDFDFLQVIEKLTIDVTILQHLCVAELLGRPFPQFKMKDLTVEMTVIPSLIPGIVRLLRSSPGLIKITVRFRRKSIQEDKRFEEILNMKGLNPDQYGLDLLTDDDESKHVASFIQLLLQNSKTLETMVLRLGDDLNAAELQKLLPTVSSHNNMKIITNCCGQTNKVILKIIQ